MNDNTKALDQSPSVNPTAMGSQDPVQPTGNMLKEKAPIGQNFSEFVRPSGAEVIPNVPQEVSDVNVEVKSDKPNLTFEHKELGIDHAGPSVPVPPVSTQNTVTLPMTEEEIETRLKTGQDDESGTNLARLLKKLIKALTLRIGS